MPGFLFLDLAVGSTSDNNSDFPFQLQRWKARDQDAQYSKWSAGGATTSPRPSPPNFLSLAPAHSALPSPRRPAPPRPGNSLACRVQTIFPYESSHSPPDRFYMLSSRSPARRPRPIFDVPCPQPPRCPRWTRPVRAQGFLPSHLAPCTGLTVHSSQCSARARPRAHLPLCIFFPSIPERSSGKPGDRAQSVLRGPVDSAECGTYCLCLGPQLAVGRASGGRWPLRGAGAGGPQS